MDKTITVVSLICPKCKQRIHWDEIVIKGGNITFNGTCCKKALTSRELNLLEFVDYQVAHDKTS